MVTQYIILILYFFVLLAIGYYASKKIHSIDDYYVGGISNANNVGIRARMYDHFKPDRLDMKNVKKDAK